MTRAHYDRSLAVLRKRVLDLGEVVAASIAASLDALQRQDVALAQDLIDADAAIDQQRHDIERDAFLLLATQQPTARDLRTVTAVTSIASELERIGDYSEGIAKLVLRMPAEPIQGSLRDIAVMAAITQALLSDILSAFDTDDLGRAGEVWSKDDQVDDLYERVFAAVIADMSTDMTAVRRGTYLLWVAHKVERMADRVANIAEQVAFIATGDVADFRQQLHGHAPPP
jgi:phosphate transport system protein